MENSTQFNNSNDWKKFEIDGKIKKTLRNKLSLLGKRVKRMGEEGIVVIDSFNGKEPEYFIMFKEDDLEQLTGLSFEIWDEQKGKFVEDSNDLILFDLTDEEKEFLNLKDGILKSF